MIPNFVAFSKDNLQEEIHEFHCPNHSKQEMDSLLRLHRNNVLKKIKKIDTKERTSNCVYNIKEFRINS